MGNAEIMKNKIGSSANKKILFLPHAMMRMSYSERMITTAEVREAVLLGEVIEEYPADRRGASCLVSYVKQDQALHVVCAPKSEYLAIITAYWPAPDQWSSDFKARK